MPRAYPLHRPLSSVFPRINLSGKGLDKQNLVVYNPCMMNPTDDNDPEYPHYNEDLFLMENWPETDNDWDNIPDYDESW